MTTDLNILYSYLNIVTCREIRMHGNSSVYVCYFTALLASKLYSVGGRVINEYGGVDGMKIGRGSRGARRNPGAVPRCTSQIQHDLESNPDRRDWKAVANLLTYGKSKIQRLAQWSKRHVISRRRLFYNNYERIVERVVNELREPQEYCGVAHSSLSGGSLGCWPRICSVLFRVSCWAELDYFIHGNSKWSKRFKYHRNYTYLLSYGAEPFLRSCQLHSSSRTPQHFMEPEGSIPCSQKPCIFLYPEPE
jgi:hypothetical protein